jgi:hypothetical protein
MHNFVQQKIGDRLQIARQNTNPLAALDCVNLVPVTDFPPETLSFQPSAISCCRRYSCEEQVPTRCLAHHSGKTDADGAHSEADG